MFSRASQRRTPHVILLGVHRVSLPKYQHHYLVKYGGRQSAYLLPYMCVHIFVRFYRELKSGSASRLDVAGSAGIAANSLIIIRRLNIATRFKVQQMPSRQEVSHTASSPVCLS